MQAARSGAAQVPSPLDSAGAQQVLSLIAQLGAVRADHAWRALCESGLFYRVDQPLFYRFLCSLGTTGLLQQDHSGELVL